MIDYIPVVEKMWKDMLDICVISGPLKYIGLGLEMSMFKR